MDISMLGVTNNSSWLSCLLCCDFTIITSSIIFLSYGISHISILILLYQYSYTCVVSLLVVQLAAHCSGKCRASRPHWCWASCCPKTCSLLQLLLSFCSSCLVSSLYWSWNKLTTFLPIWYEYLLSFFVCMRVVYFCYCVVCCCCDKRNSLCYSIDNKWEGEWQ